MSKVTRTNPYLWEQVKKELLEKNDGNWSARLAQQAVREYKKRGGEYIGNKSESNSLVKWTKEDWGYIGEPKKSRYLPKKVRDVMPKDLKEIENKLKGTKLGQNIPYSENLLKLLKKKKII